MTPVVVFSPAKINLFLAITGRREDGFHDLVSVAAPLEFGDTLWIEPSGDADFSLECDDPAVPRDDANLVLRAARAYRAATGWPHNVRFILRKRVPMGAGLGGGSSNAAAVLTGLNTLAGHRLAPEALERVAAQLGSDCVLFLASQPVVMRGRGERIERLSESVAQRLRGTRLLLFKPDFGISTVWAYRQMAAGAPHTYLPAPDAESRLRAWLDSPTAPVSELLFNNMERPAFTKFPALPALLERLKGEFGLAVGMSGSGSACYAILSETTPVAAVLACIHESWGPETFAVETRVR